MSCSHGTDQPVRSRIEGVGREGKPRNPDADGDATRRVCLQPVAHVRTDVVRIIVGIAGGCGEIEFEAAGVDAVEHASHGAA